MDLARISVYEYPMICRVQVLCMPSYFELTTDPNRCASRGLRYFGMLRIIAM